MYFVLVTEANETIFRHGKLLNDFNTGDILKHHFVSICFGYQPFCPRNNFKIHIMASIAIYKVHWDSF